MFETGLEIERKFLVRDADLTGLDDLKLTVSNVVYLDPKELVGLEVKGLPKLDITDPDNTEIRVAHRVSGDTERFTMTTKIGGPQLSRVEAKAKIDQQAFDDIRAQFGRHEIKKKRFVFNYLRKKFELDVIPDLHVLLLEVEFDEGEPTIVALPPFVEVIREVTGDPKYYTHSMAKQLSLVGRAII